MFIEYVEIIESPLADFRLYINHGSYSDWAESHGSSTQIIQKLTETSEVMPCAKFHSKVKYFNHFSVLEYLNILNFFF